MGRREADVARLTHRLRSLAALLALLALLVGVPMLLALVAGWPLPRRAPDWSLISTALQQGDIPGETVIKVLAVLVWLAWAQLAVDLQQGTADVAVLALAAVRPRDLVAADIILVAGEIGRAHV